MAALYPRYAAFLRAGDTVVLETGSSSLGVTPTILPDGVRVEAQVLWGSIGWATPAAFGVALADPSRRAILITGEGSHQLTANDIGAMGRFGANPSFSYSTIAAILSSGRWSKIRTGPTTTSRLGTTPNCPRRLVAPTGSLRV